MRRAIPILWLLSALLAAPAWAAVAIDTGFPKCVSQNGATGGTLTTAAQSTAGTNRLMVVVVTCASGNTPYPVSISDSATLTWTKQVEAKFTTGSFVNDEGSTVWTAPASSTLTSWTATVTRSTSASANSCDVCAYGVSGATLTGTGASATLNDPTGGTSQAIATTVNATAAGSMVFGCWTDGNAAGTLVGNASTTIDSTVNDTGDGDALSCGHETSTTSGAGNVTIGTTTTDTFATAAAYEVCASGNCSAGGTVVTPSRSMLGVGTIVELFRSWSSVAYFPREVRL